MLQSAIYRMLRIFFITLDFWFNTDQSSFPLSQAQRSGKPSQSILLENLTTPPSSAQETKMSSSDLAELDTWEEIYKEECLSFKARLETQVNRIHDVRKELMSLSHQAERIKEAAFEMIDQTPDSVYVRNATPEWLSSRFGDPQLEQVCISMEYSLDRLAFELRSDPSMDLMVAGHLEQMTDDIEMDFL
jgi:hypothetical protein